MSKPLIIYHGNCADGFGAAWVAWKYFNGEADFFPGVHQQPPPDVTGRDVYLLDFSYKYDVMRKMMEGPNRCNLLVILDHHKTAAKEVADLEAYMGLTMGLTIGTNKLQVVMDMSRSGAMIAWDYFYRDRFAPELIKHIQDRDLWQFKLDGTREISAALFSYEYDFALWDKLISSAEEDSCSQLYKEGIALERKHFKDIKELLKVNQRYMVIGNTYVPVASLPYTMSSDAGHIMSKGLQTFAACYSDGPNGRMFSLRSADDGMDVSEIAKQYGGGGHAHAAGFTVPRDHELSKI